MSKVADQITNLRKAQNKKETDRKELADVIEQEKLIEVRGVWWRIVRGRSSLIRDSLRPQASQAAGSADSASLG